MTSMRPQTLRLPFTPTGVPAKGHTLISEDDVVSTDPQSLKSLKCSSLDSCCCSTRKLFRGRLCQFGNRNIPTANNSQNHSFTPESVLFRLCITVVFELPNTRRPLKQIDSKRRGHGSPVNCSARVHHRRSHLSLA